MPLPRQDPRAGRRPAGAGQAGRRRSPNSRRCRRAGATCGGSARTPRRAGDRRRTRRRTTPPRRRRGAGRAPRRRTWRTPAPGRRRPAAQTVLNRRGGVTLSLIDVMRLHEHREAELARDGERGPRVGACDGQRRIEAVTGGRRREGGFVEGALDPLVGWQSEAQVRFEPGSAGRHPQQRGVGARDQHAEAAPGHGTLERIEERLRRGQRAGDDEACARPSGKGARAPARSASTRPPSRRSRRRRALEPQPPPLSSRRR